MKAILYLLMALLSFNTFSQDKKASTKKKVLHKKSNTINRSADPVQTNFIDTSNKPNILPRQTITEQRLNGTSNRNTAITSSSGNSKTSDINSPFVSGIHPANNASKTFDTSGANVNNTMNIAFSTSTSREADTMVNGNTVNQGPVTTNSGTVDRSGQVQLGQTNWGENRSTVGESQWTVPPPVSAAFNKEFPAINSAVWARNNLDSTVYTARYRSGNYWVNANYNSIGERLETRTEIPYAQAPRPIRDLFSTRFNGVDIITINRIQLQGKRDMYELKTRSGRTIYVNNEGTEVNY